MTQFDRTLFVVRHAHRDTTDRDLDNGLSDRGRAQALAISQHLSSVSKTAPKMLSSPKLRCIETLEPLSHKLQTKIEIDHLMDERGPNESLSDFQRRIESWIESWRASPSPLTIISSHGDWIPEMTEKLVSQRIELNKGGIIEIKTVADKTVIFDVRQKLI